MEVIVIICLHTALELCQMNDNNMQLIILNIMMFFATVFHACTCTLAETYPEFFLGEIQFLSPSAHDFILVAISNGM